MAIRRDVGGPVSPMTQHLRRVAVANPSALTSRVPSVSSAPAPALRPRREARRDVPGHVEKTTVAAAVKAGRLRNVSRDDLDRMPVAMRTLHVELSLKHTDGVAGFTLPLDGVEMSPSTFSSLDVIGIRMASDLVIRMASDLVFSQRASALLGDFVAPRVEEGLLRDAEPAHLARVLRNLHDSIEFVGDMLPGDVRPARLRSQDPLLSRCAAEAIRKARDARHLAGWREQAIETFEMGRKILAVELGLDDSCE